MSPASVQLRLDLDSVAGDVARFGSGARAHRLAALDVTGADQSLASADDAQQEELLAGRALFLNAQLSEFQVLVRAEPVDLTTHLARIQQQALGVPEALAGLARDYAVFLQTLAHQRTLLERRCYVLLPLPEPTPRAGGRRVLELVRRWLGRAAPAETALAEADLARQLVARCDQVARDLARSGLQTRRLSGLGYAQLAHRCWAPEQARAQRFQREIDDYTTLVVGADRHRTGSRPAVGAGSPAEPGDSRAGRGLSRDERLLALGARTLADLVAPGACEVYADHLRLDGQYARVLALTAYPRTVTAGWLAPLVESDLPIELSLHVRPLDSAAMVRALGTHVARLQAGRLAAVRGERVADPEQEIALEDAERLRGQLQRGDERVFSVGLYVLVRATSPRALDDVTRRVETLLDGMLAQSRWLRWQQEPGLRSCLPEGRDQVQVVRNLDTSALAATLPFVGGSLAMERGVLYGISARTQEPVIVDPFDDRFDNYHLAVMAPTGSGKSYFVKLQALRSLIGGTDYLVVDPEDEYRPVADAVGGQMVRLAPSSHDQINPLDLVLPDTDDVGGAAGALAEAIGTVVGRLELLLCAGMGPAGAPGLLEVHERALLDRALHQTYAAAGITPDTLGDGRPAPLLRDLQAALATTEGEVAARLALRLERHARAGLFAGPTSVALGSALVVFQIRDLPRELWPLAIHWIGGHVWMLARRQRRPRRLIADEAATLLAHPSGGAFLAELARRARKHYVGLVTIVQKVADLTGSEHGDTILTNAAMKLLLKQSSDTISAADARFRLTTEERRWLLGAGKGEGLLLVDNQRHQLRILASRAEHRLITTNPRELAELQAQSSADTAAMGSPVPAGAAGRNGHAAAGRTSW